MRVAYYLPKGESLSGCDLWRVALPMKAAQELDEENEYVEINDFKFKKKGNRIVGTNVDPSDFDVVFVARPFVGDFDKFTYMVQRDGIKFVMEFDDDLTDVHEGNIARESFDDRTLEAFETMIKISDGVTVTTETLAEKFGHLNDNFQIIDNFVPDTMVRQRARPKDNILGWAGGLGVHPSDIEEVGMSVRDFLWKNRDWKFHHVGDGHVNKKLKCPTVEFGQVKVLEYMAQMERFKVGIAPLEDTPFNHSKSRLKVLEMAALGVPWIASPRHSYTKVHEEEGLGILAETEDEWSEAIEKYRASEFYRMTEVQKGLRWARKNTYQRNWTQWRDFFLKILDN